MYDQAVLIGRFQPFHNEHLRLLETTLKEAHHVTILLGSFNASPNFRNPWTCQERRDFICEALSVEQKARVSFEYIRDYLYNDNNWISQVQNKVTKCGAAVKEALKRDAVTVCLSGVKKDGTSQYLDYFPAWRKIGPSFHNPLNATFVRERFFGGFVDWKSEVPEGVAKCMLHWKEMHPERYEALAEEQRFILDYRAKWAVAPYPPTFVTVDPVVICGGHVLVVKRGGNPGKGLYALPGGFLDQDETVREAVIRELIEETGILYPMGDLVSSMRETKVFDHPLRSTRGRTITHAQLFVINGEQLPKIVAGDDAAGAEWMSLSDLQENEAKFYEDHYHMISHFVMRL